MTTRREFIIGATATAVTLASAQNLASAQKDKKPQHKAHDFLTRIGIDSTSIPSDLTVSFKDSNRSVLHVETYGLSKAFDIRTRGGQTSENITKKLQTFFVTELDAKLI